MFNPDDWQTVADPDGKALAAAQKAQAAAVAGPMFAQAVAVLHALEQLKTAHEAPFVVAFQTSSGETITIAITTDKPCPEAS
jgi:hypothetical protein